MLIYILTQFASEKAFDSENGKMPLLSQIGNARIHSFTLFFFSSSLAAAYQIIKYERASFECFCFSFILHIAKKNDASPASSFLSFTC